MQSFRWQENCLEPKMSSSHLAGGSQQVTVSLQALRSHSVSKEARPDNLTTFSCPEDLCWNRKWQPTPVFLPGKFHGQRSLAGPWGCEELDVTERSEDVCSLTVLRSIPCRGQVWKSPTQGGTQGSESVCECQ